jgi:hypothetical protein
MMITFLARIGQALSPLAALVPWLGPRSGLVLAVVAALGVAGLWAYTEHRQALSEAVASRDAYWKEKIEKANDEAEREAEEARREGENVPPTPERPDDLARLCQADNLCRRDDGA